jgi:adenylyltransferase/sulfurtransferase
MTALNKEELQRYSRHLIIPEFNIDGQSKLKEAKILVVGAGGLGSPALYYLAAAGTGHIGIVDGDNVSIDNLQRQILYDMHDVGKSKAMCARARLESLNPHCHIQTHNTVLSKDNALHILKGYDIVIDASDNFPTRYLVNDACTILKKPLVYGSVFRFEGQVSVFNYENTDGTRGPNYRDLFPSPPAPGLTSGCDEAGVIGALPGIIGSMQAIEAIKIATGTGEPLSGRLYLLDAYSFEARTIRITTQAGTPAITALVDYEAFCGVEAGSFAENLPEYTADQLHAILQAGEKKPQLIDVREPYEYDIARLDAELIPLGQLADNLHKIDRNREVVVYCRSGQRSATAVRWLQKEQGFTRVFNLRGGLLSWAENIDPDMAAY